MFKLLYMVFFFFSLSVIGDEYYDFSVKNQFVEEIEMKINDESENWQEEVFAYLRSGNKKQKKELIGSLINKSWKIKNKSFNNALIEILLNEYVKDKVTYSFLFHSIVDLNRNGALLNPNSLTHLSELSRKQDKTKNDFLLISELRPSLFKKKETISGNAPEVLYENKKEFDASFSSPKWGLMLSKANSGDEIAINNILKIIKSEKNELFKVTQLFKDLRFVNQPKIKDYLKSYLFMENRLPKLKSNIPGSKYASYAALILSKLETSFPFDNKEFFDDSDIEVVRKWYIENVK